MHRLCLTWTPTRDETKHNTFGGGLLPFGEPFFNITIAKHGDTGLTQVLAHTNSIQRRQEQQ